jgi:Galactose oxidase, central domain/Kelch motif
MPLSPSTPPSPRSYLAMTYDAVSGKIIMFGGYDGSTYLNDTWTFDGVSWTRAVTRISPPPRANAQMAYDSVTRKVVLFGGYNGTNYLGDTWLWDDSTLQWRPARPVHSPAAVTGPMLLIGNNCLRRSRLPRVALPKRANSCLDCGKQILWRSQVDAFAAEHATF